MKAGPPAMRRGGRTGARGRVRFLGGVTPPDRSQAAEWPAWPLDAAPARATKAHDAAASPPVGTVAGSVRVA